MPFGAVWAEYCHACGVPQDGDWYADVQNYEADVLKGRN